MTSLRAFFDDEAHDFPAHERPAAVGSPASPSHRAGTSARALPHRPPRCYGVSPLLEDPCTSNTRPRSKRCAPPTPIACLR